MVAWDTLVVLTCCYMVFADPLSISFLRAPAMPALDLLASIVLVVDVPRRAASIVHEHRQAMEDTLGPGRTKRKGEEAVTATRTMSTT